MVGLLICSFVLLNLLGSGEVDLKKGKISSVPKQFGETTLKTVKKV